MIDFTFCNRLPEILSTGRLVLRRPDEADAEAMSRLANNKKIHAVTSHMPYPYTLKDAIEFINKTSRSKTEHAFSVHTRDGDFIGTFGFTNRNDFVEIGYWFGEVYWGEGYASEVVATMVEQAFTAGCSKISARAISSNRASCRVLEKSGFLKTGERLGDCGQHNGVSISFYEREQGR